LFFDRGVQNTGRTLDTGRGLAAVADPAAQFGKSFGDFRAQLSGAKDVVSANCDSGYQQNSKINNFCRRRRS